MNAAVTAYLADLAARRISRSRRHQSQHALSLLTTWLHEAHQIDDWRAVTENHLRSFLVYLQRDYRSAQQRRVQAASIQNWWACIRAFCAWQQQRGRLLYSPAAAILLPQVARVLPHVLNESEIVRLIESPDTTTTIGLRDRALLEVLYATGIRHGEAHRLDLFDLDLRARRLTIREGKGQRDRVVPLTANACHWLSRYLSIARPELASGQLWGKGKSRKTRVVAAPPALWLAVTGRRFSYQMIAQIVRQYAAAAEVKANVHTFRHCCATHLLRHGADLRYIQRLLGHDRIDTTMLYTHLDLTDLQAAVAKLEPDK